MAVKWLDKLRARIVDDWRQGWRWWSVRCNAIGLALVSLSQAMPFDPISALGFFNMMPGDVRAMLPKNITLILGTGLFILGLPLRFIDQKKLQKGKTDGDE